MFHLLATNLLLFGKISSLPKLYIYLSYTYLYKVAFKDLGTKFSAITSPKKQTNEFISLP